jgi:hypothetical protein
MNYTQITRAGSFLGTLKKIHKKISLGEFPIVILVNYLGKNLNYLMGKIPGPFRVSSW